MTPSEENTNHGKQTEKLTKTPWKTADYKPNIATH